MNAVLKEWVGGKAEWESVSLGRRKQVQRGQAWNVLESAGPLGLEQSEKGRWWQEMSHFCYCYSQYCHCCQYDSLTGFLCFHVLL